MYYKKPKISYTAMAIYIDGKINDPDPKVQETCFEYMWHLYYILAVKGKMFNVGRDYDEYALYAATQLYLRYKRDKDIRNGNKLKPIKSVLNYIKRTLYPFRVNYQKMTFQEEFRQDSLGGEHPTQIYEDRVAKIRENTNSLMNVEYRHYINTICKTIKNFLRQSPYQKDKVMMHNIYLSCLLTFLKTITMSNKNIARVKNKEDKALPIVDLVDKIYAEEKNDDTVVFHLDPSMKNYITTLVNRIKKEVTKDLNYIVGSFEPTRDVIESMLVAPLEDILETQ